MSRFEVMGSQTWGHEPPGIPLGFPRGYVEGGIIFEVVGVVELYIS